MANATYYAERHIYEHEGVVVPSVTQVLALAGIDDGSAKNQVGSRSASSRPVSASRGGGGLRRREPAAAEAVIAWEVAVKPWRRRIVAAAAVAEAVVVAVADVAAAEAAAEINE